MLEKPEDIFKDPYILEFTGLPEMVLILKRNWKIEL